MKPKKPDVTSKTETVAEVNIVVGMLLTSPLILFVLIIETL